MSYQPKRRWFCFQSGSPEEFAIGSETYCRFERHGEHSVACGWKVLIDADSWRARSDFGVVPHRDRVAPDLREHLAFVFDHAVSTDGGHHKQWYLEHIAAQLGIDLPDHEPGIAP